VIRPYRIFYLTQSSLKLRSDVQLTFMQAHVRPEPRAITKSASSAITVMLSNRSWHLEHGVNGSEEDRDPGAQAAACRKRFSIFLSRFLATSSASPQETDTNRGSTEAVSKSRQISADSRSDTFGRSPALLQLRVLRLSLLQDGDVGIRIFPSGEEFVIGIAAFLAVTLHGIGSPQADLRKRRIHLPPTRSTLI
jgi:hypothetical protein